MEETFRNGNKVYWGKYENGEYGRFSIPFLKSCKRILDQATRMKAI